MLGILVGVGWLVFQPNWTISKSNQIQVKGNHYLSEMTIRSILAIRYPQALMDLEPEKLRNSLLSRRSIVSATVDRAVLPPHLTVQIEDLRPVAVVVRNFTEPATTFIDEGGVEVPIANYLPKVQQAPPKLRLLQPERDKCPNWTELYPVIEASPVAIGLIDCRNPQNVFLQTEVGKIRIGSIATRQRLTDQIHQLDRLRNWQKSNDPTQVDYLDLESPKLPPKLKLKSPDTNPPDPKQINN